MKDNALAQKIAREGESAGFMLPHDRRRYKRDLDYIESLQKDVVQFREFGSRNFNYLGHVAYGSGLYRTISVPTGTKRIMDWALIKLETK